MNEVPAGARPAARVLVISEGARILLFQALNDQSQTFWVAPGGGLEADETFEQAALRELREETGIVVPITPCNWTRHHVFEWNGEHHSQYERFFVARVDARFVPQLTHGDDYIIGHNWWTLEAIQASSDHFAPRRLAQLLPPIFRGEIPDSLIDVGV